MVSFSGAGRDVPPAGPYRRGAEQQELEAQPLPREWLRQEHVGTIDGVDVKPTHIDIDTTFSSDPLKTGKGRYDTKNRILLCVYMGRGFTDQAVAAIGKKLKITIEPVYEDDE